MQMVFFQVHSLFLKMILFSNTVFQLFFSYSSDRDSNPDLQLAPDGHDVNHFRLHSTSWNFVWKCFVAKLRRRSDPDPGSGPRGSTWRVDLSNRFQTFRQNFDSRTSEGQRGFDVRKNWNHLPKNEWK